MKFREAVERRKSCRTFRGKPLSDEDREAMERLLEADMVLPFGTRPRLVLLAAREGDNKSLKNLGTYGIIKNAPAYIAGAMPKEGDKNLEDFGFAMESIILEATKLGLGTCWLGGTFTKSGFGARMNLSDTEVLPAVTALGYPAEKRRVMETLIRRGSGADRRISPEKLFFSGEFGSPLIDAGPYGEALELLRLAPSASNHQPWRVIVRDGVFHFYIQRTKNYYSRYKTLIGMEDLQRVDMGIAMCHFEGAAREAGLSGRWISDEPELASLPELTEYSVTWTSRE